MGKISGKEIQFQTPESLTDRVQDFSEAKRLPKLKKNFDWPKKQVYKKYNHRNEYKNPDGTPIKDKIQFRDAQIRLVKDSNSYLSKAIQISKDHDPRDCYLFIDDITRQVIQANPIGDSLEYVSTRTFSPEEYDRFKRHGVIGEDWTRLPDVSFMTHGISA